MSFLALGFDGISPFKSRRFESWLVSQLDMPYALEDIRLAKAGENAATISSRFTKERHHLFLVLYFIYSNFTSALDLLPLFRRITISIIICELCNAIYLI